MGLLKFSEIPVAGNPIGLTPLRKITDEQTFPDQLNGFIESPEIKAYPLMAAANFPLRVKGVIIKTDIGSIKFSLKVNEEIVLFGEDGILEVTSEGGIGFCNQAVRVGDRVELDIIEISSDAADLEFTIGLEK